jgi:phosphatidylglycerophosphatase A
VKAEAEGSAAMAIATWFGCGYFPWGPGTIGSLAGLLIYAGLHFWLGAARWTLVLLIAALTPLGIWAATRAARIVQKKDPGLVVVDEVLGEWVTLLGATTFNVRSMIAAFILFRIFDIWKPWPVRQFETLPEGVGIVADDLAAGIYGALILYIGGVLRLY